MGLDNGIYIKTKNKILFEIFKRFFSDFEELENNEYDIEICYWRKCWNLRDGIMEKLNYSKNSLVDYELSLKDIKMVIEVLKSTEWLEGNFFSKKEIEEMIKKDIKVLKMIYFFKRLYPSLKVFFYDSY